MKKGNVWSWGIFAGVLFASSTGWAVPTRQEAYRNDKLGIVVYRDSSDPEVFWHLPILKPLEAEGRVTFRKKARPNGTVDYTFYLVPQFPDELAEFVAHEIPGLHHRRQLKPVKAKRFGLQSREFRASALTEEVTDHRYMDTPQLIRLSLDASQAEDFEDLLAAAPGVPVGMAIYYESERVEKFVRVELSYREVFDAMRIAASGRYTFTRAEILAQMTEYLGNKYLIIKSKGDVKIPEIVDQVIKQCFTPASPPSAGRPSIGLAMVPQVAEVAKRNAEREVALRERGSPEVGLLQPSVLAAAGVDAAAEFTFKKEYSSRSDTFVYQDEKVADAEEIAIVPSFLTRQPSAPQARVVTPLETRFVRATVLHDAGHPLGTGVVVAPGQQWTIQAAFTLSALSPYGKGVTSYYRWDAAWPRVDGDLYYRVGSGPWTPVNGRAVIGSDSLQSGEVQLFEDRPAIWAKIPEDMRSSSMLGLVPAIFVYKDTFPEFNVTLTGRLVK